MYKFIIFIEKMGLLYLFGLSNCGVVGRAINISSTWFLPQESFPVFYRYFKDKVTWNEAEAVCGFHHADLLSVQTSTQMDAVRAYLKEIDVTDNIWIGLQKDSPENPFSWTNGEKLLGDGYWTEPIPKSNEKLCAAIDPIADFRWNSFYCRGPQVASFVCELPVPDWAKKENGCLITSLPSLTVTLLPEAGVIQLLSDCGLDGTRRIACNGAMNREEIIKRLSCDVDAFASTFFSKSTTTDTLREIENRYKTSPLTRHRRSPEFGTTSSVPVRGKTSLPQNSSINQPSHGFPHSPYLASVRNAPSTRRPHTIKSGKTEAKHSEVALPSSVSIPKSDTSFKELPVLLITDEKLNESSATSENPQLVLMIENKDLEEPFLVPLSDDIYINNPSFSPVEVINVDLIGMNNLTTNSTINQTSFSASPETFFQNADAYGKGTQLPMTSQPEAEVSNTLHEESKEMDISQRPNRGRFLTRSSHPSFYPRFLCKATRRTPGKRFGDKLLRKLVLI